MFLQAEKAIGVAQEVETLAGKGELKLATDCLNDFHQLFSAPMPITRILSGDAATNDNLRSLANTNRYASRGEFKL